MKKEKLNRKEGIGLWEVEDKSTRLEKIWEFYQRLAEIKDNIDATDSNWQSKLFEKTKELYRWMFLK